MPEGGERATGREHGRAYLGLRGLAKSYGQVPVVEIDALDVHRGELFALLGPSGCGKSTTMRMIAGFEQPDRGEVWLEGESLRHRPIHRRGVAMVFQDYSLFPHMTVFANIAFGLRMQRVPDEPLRKRVAATLETMRLSGFDHRFPRELSGGQQQRVALARALVVDPKVLLLDEPLSNLDAKLREEMRIELKDIQRSTGVTMIFVTHDIEEAFALADRIAVMNRGRIEQLGSATDIYYRPTNEFIATFVGQPNVFAGTLQAGPGPGDRGFHSRSGLAMSVNASPDLAPGTVGKVFVRPEHVLLSTSGSESGNSFRATVERRIFLGEVTRYVLRIGDDRIMALATREFAEGSGVTACWSPEHALFLRQQ